MVENAPKKPFTVFWTGRFTQRKHRFLHQRIVVDRDGDWEFSAIANLTPDTSLRFHVVILDPDGYKLSLKPLPTELLGTPSFPAAMLPMVPYPAGSRIEITAELEPDVFLGRKRPRAALALMGYQTYR